MLRQSSGGGSCSSAGSSGVGTKISSGISRLSVSSAGSSGPARISKSGSESADGPDTPTSDPHYILQLVSDVRKFADVLLQLKEVFGSKGNFMESVNRVAFVTFFRRNVCIVFFFNCSNQWVAEFSRRPCFSPVFVERAC